ncbi:DUF2199 domain-containing protein [Actinokineospora sp. NBRC 105648]|uniref:DUF2199 domain-containing protein n=1 Tax=Actinokineospora sp. NBRC 105648 TaxID=3032206 RepID=UPI0024A184BD|nr:DUF2199 domain-containing protein [Actinokineospora sp. NBRC 105648]GLZ42743.1 hypothetical protein Acsp05_63670 [Actinokineospora sp. NBRC 105648]
MTDLSFDCATCGERHGEPPLSYHAEAPDYWTPEAAADPRSALTSEQCVIAGTDFFVRGLIEIPVLGSQEVFSWGVWVSLSPANFERTDQRWTEPGRETDPPCFGWLSTRLACYPVDTLNLKTNVHTRPVGERPFVEIEPTGHPLAVEQRAGITRDRVREIAERLLHPGVPAPSAP